MGVWREPIIPNSHSSYSSNLAYDDGPEGVSTPVCFSLQMIGEFVQGPRAVGGSRVRCISPIKEDDDPTVVGTGIYHTTLKNAEIM